MDARKTHSTSARQRVRREQRFTRANPCPVCGGYDGQRRGERVRCHGFISDDGGWAYCARPEYAGGIEINPKSETFPHSLTGNCRCGVRHDPAPPASLSPNGLGPKPNPLPENSGEAGEAAQYVYPDAAGRPYMRVQRTADKRFFQQRYDAEAGEYKNGLDGREPILYRADKLAHEYDKSKPLFIVEGEKDADRLIAEGLQATTSPMGAGKWRPEYADQLDGFEDVRIIPDNDDPGRRHAEQIAASL